jgi:CxxC motif-containing protein (DUF1111 family)
MVPHMRSGPLLLALALAATRVHATGGGPLPGLTDAQLSDFKEGFLAFRAPVSQEQGLGPVYNMASCYPCHGHPALGGQTPKTVMRFGRVTDGVFDPLVSEGGSLLQTKAIRSSCAEVIPASANLVVSRNVSSALGAGLIEAIPDQQIIDRATAEQAENAAWAGRAAMVTGVSDGLSHVGRFGWKAQAALLVDVVGQAMVDELGFTNALFPTENAPNGDLGLLAQCDSVPDPEDTIGFLDKVTRLLRYLGPPTAPRVNEVVMQGEALFDSIGCAFCHYVGYTAVSSISAIDGQRVALYSDLLLHDVGTGDGIVQGDAQGNEFRTAPLWLVRGTHPYLHDGRARTVTEAISAHQGQALDARNAYLALASADQHAIQKFLLAR